jgi:hypothetical protein
MRSIGPAFTSGRVSRFRVDPTNPARYYVAVASGGVWKTINAGITWTPVFDNEGSYSIGAIALDPKNPLPFGSARREQQPAQRFVRQRRLQIRRRRQTWRNVGLRTSEHIGRIAIDPKDSNIVYVASQGPLWGPGGERGLFKTTDGGKTWKNILNISENTGVTDVVIDPNDPNTIYCASYQRRRTCGHSSTVVRRARSTNRQTPARPGTSCAPACHRRTRTNRSRDLSVDSNVIYATVEARIARRNLSLERSRRQLGTAQRVRPTAMYYARIVADPKDVDRIYVMNVF